MPPVPHGVPPIEAVIETAIYTTDLDAAERFYADLSDERFVSALAPVHQRYSTNTFPAWPLLQALARGRAMEDHVHLVDSVAEATGLMGAHGA